MKCKLFVCLIFLFFSGILLSQEKRERETRIKESAFPKVALKTISSYLEDAKRIRFYREFDGEKISYETKFKKDRLFFSVEFDSIGVLEDVEFLIKKVDIPEDSWKKIETYLEQKFDRPRIKKIQQQYTRQNGDDGQTLKEAFQNLLVPYMNYELIISSKNGKGFQEYELLFDSNGTFVKLRKSSPQKYDHVLY
ncbi:hypothetical protein [Allomuricauda sp. SCSIO 65647]|uniref:hypothetical protein n=1 Tax=Allomuricauda sp. SCSIO 65647 TaxID=2908843 RepID=UPI001F2AEF1B|nr:hypothetical protein [Muricauda sp. SCSIO 65647]UJH66160.1 hypothetical protein L0P89_09255 [Muricauda sp. SCSIO 65647]